MKSRPNARTSRAQVTLARALSKLGVASREQARVLITAGAVEVNGRSVRQPDAWVDLRSAVIRVEGQVVRPAPPAYIMVHKPAGVVTTRSDERGRRTVFDLLPDAPKGLCAVGRLDKETTGLLILTNDTRLGNALTDPLHHVPKTYRVTLDAPLPADMLATMRKGMVLADGTRLLPVTVDATERPETIRMTLREGKNRQVRRMCEAAGRAVIALCRESVGPLVLGGLAEGASRSLEDAEVRLLGQVAGVAPRTRRRSHGED